MEVNDLQEQMKAVQRMQEYIALFIKTNTSKLAII